MKKILFIASSNNPFTATQGSSQRSNLLLQACTKFADVDVISFCTEGEQPVGDYQIVYQRILPSDKKEGRLKKFSHLLTPWIPNTLYQVDRRRETIIDNYIAKKQYDCIVIRYIPQAISCGLMKYADRLIIDVDDNPVDKAKNEARTARSWRNRVYHLFYSEIMKIGLKAVIKQTKNVFFSNHEQAKEWSKPFLPNIPFYDNISSINSQNEIKGRILFVGDLGYSLNQKGICHFLKNIYPVLKTKFPELTLHLVGRIWDEELKKQWEKHEGVTVTGFVPSLIDEYNDSQVVIIPLYHGAGTCIKVLEAMQMNKPCVTTPVGFRGYDGFFKVGEDCLVAYTDDEFVIKIESLLCDKALRRKISASANEKVQTFFTKDNFNSIVRTTCYD